MREDKFLDYKVQWFESLSEIADYIDNTKELREYSLTKESELSVGGGFYGVTKFDGLTDRLRYGDKKVTQMYISKLKSLVPEGDSNTGINMDIEGFAYDMGAVVSGEPECCVRMDAPDTKPALKIFIDTGYNGGVHPDVIANRGVAILQLISNLLSRGYILDVNVIHFIDTSTGARVAQCVKLSTDFLTTSQLAFTGTCEFFRIITWLLTAIQIGCKGYTGSGCSRPSTAVINEFKKDGLYIPSGYTSSFFNHCSLNEAIDEVAKIYNKYAEEKQCK